MKYVILAGGSGTRLWPLSRRALPKQFLDFGASDSLLQRTVRRFYPRVAVEEILVICPQIYFHLVKSQLMAIDPLLSAQILIEPEPRGTAPAICLALKHLQTLYPDETVFVSSADHDLAPAEALLPLVEEAAALAYAGHHVLFGVPPHYPETGYGYIAKGDAQDNNAYAAKQFIEKPSLQKAEHYLASGNYLWNAGLFLFHIPTFFTEMESLYSLPKSAAELHSLFSQLPALSIDHALLEKSSRILVVPLPLRWTDLGSWDSVYACMEKDAHLNAKQGRVVDRGSKGCLFWSQKKLIATSGLEDLLIVDTEDALFIGKRGASQEVKALVQEVEALHPTSSLESPTTYRPWGTFTVLEEGPRYKIKRIVVAQGEKLSLQLHHHRSEHWVVVRGTAKVTLGDQDKLIHENESIYVEKSQVHRLENVGKVPLELIEVQVGEYVGEDDIVRLEDSYQRT